MEIIVCENDFTLLKDVPPGGVFMRDDDVYMRTWVDSNTLHEPDNKMIDVVDLGCGKTRGMHYLAEVQLCKARLYLKIVGKGGDNNGQEDKC